jgi:hypothetical protein
MRRQAVVFLSAFVIWLCPAMMPAQSNQSTNEQNKQGQTLVDPGQIYNDRNPTSWVGKSVTLKNVTVQDTNDSGNFWVGSDSDHRLLVIKPSPAQDANVSALKFHKGDIVTISGVVQAASDYLASQTSADKGSMEDAKDSSGVFLMAKDISISSSTHR